MTDKIDNGLVEVYAGLFNPIKDKTIKLLELGILKGESLLYWKDYFKNGKIIGYDHKLPEVDCQMIQGRQEDVYKLQQLGNDNAPFDIIIDDCSHYGHYTQISLDFLWKHLKSGGYYCIEDWHASFQMGEWRGMNDVIAELVRNFDRWRIAEMSILKGIVIIKKL